MSIQPLISIVIPSYNSSGTIRHCLNSIASQTFREFEVIVADGKSKDNTVEILEEYAKQYSLPLKWISEKDEGIYDAVNKGIRLSSGKWIYVLGTDDALYAPDTLAKIAPVLTNTGEEIVYGNVKVIGDAGWAKDGTIHDGEFPLSKLLQRNICQQSVFYPATVFDRIGFFNRNYRVCADWDFILRCAAQFKLKYIEQVIAAFHGGGASTAGESETFYDDFASNLYKYFGRRIRKKEFEPVAWRFAKQAALERKRGNWWRAFVFRSASVNNNSR